MLPPRDQLDNPARQLFRDRPDGRGLPRQLPHLVRPRPHRAAARYDDLVRVRCWVRELASRRVTFGYAVERAGTDELLATGETSLIALTHQHTLTRIPEHVLDLLKPIPDPVRL